MFILLTILLVNQLLGLSYGQSDEAIGPYTTVDKACQFDVQGVDDQRIIGGVDAERGFFPYIVSLQTQDETDPNFYNHFCGGTIIRNRVILTAAHCVWTDGAADFRVGETSEGIPRIDIYVAIGPYCRHQEGMGRFKVVKYYIHELYGGQPRDGSDIALLVLEEGLFYPGPYADYSKAGSISDEDLGDLTAIGWGATEPAEKFPFRFLSTVKPLQQAGLIVEEAQSCKEKAQQEREIYNIDDDVMICAINPGQDTCVGDSGGPLLYLGPDQTERIQVGLTSWGPDLSCAGFKGLPGVYTRISTFIVWIDVTSNKITSEFGQLPFAQTKASPQGAENITQTPVTPTPTVSTPPASEVIDTELPPKDPFLSNPVPPAEPASDIPEECSLPLEAGFGEAYIPSYYFEPITDRCVEFGWSGLGGNDNNFSSKEKCVEKCGGVV